MMSMVNNFLSLSLLAREGRQVKMILMPERIEMKILEESIKTYILFFCFLTPMILILVIIYSHIELAWVIWLSTAIIFAMYIFLRDMS